VQGDAAADVHSTGLRVDGKDFSHLEQGLLDLFEGARRIEDSGAAPPVHAPIVEDFVDRLAMKMDSGEGAVLFEAINRNASAHFVGGIPISDSGERGAVDPYLCNGRRMKGWWAGRVLEAHFGAGLTKGQPLERMKLRSCNRGATGVDRRAP
jgi:hypothetical protein